jgi:uncharacterized protein (UPF0333 family)
MHCSTMLKLLITIGLVAAIIIACSYFLMMNDRSGYYYLANPAG